jgi:hypothetical protein
MSFNVAAIRITTNRFMDTKIKLNIHKSVCGVQNIHNLFCGLCFQFQCPQDLFSCVSIFSQLKILSASSVYSVVKIGGRP